MNFFFQASLPPSIRHFSVSNCSSLELGPIFLLSSSSGVMVNQLETVIIQNIGKLKLQSKAFHFIAATTVVLRNVAGSDFCQTLFM